MMMLRHNRAPAALLMACLTGGLLSMGQVQADVIVTPSELAEQVKAHVLENAPPVSGEATLHVECMRLPLAPIQLKGDDLKVLLDSSQNSAQTPRSIVQVTLSTNAETRHLGIPVRITTEKPVWVTTRLIRAKEPITAKDLVVQRKQMDTDAPYALGTDENLANYNSRINLPPGSILDVRKLNVVPAVYRNDDIHLVMAMPNGVNITVMGKALEDGTIGRRIRVKQQLASGKVKNLYGQVIGKNTVKVTL